MTLEDLVQAGDINGAEDIMVSIADEVFDSQDFVLANPDIIKMGNLLKDSIKSNHPNEAYSKTKSITSAVYHDHYPFPSAGQFNSNIEGIVDKNAAKHAEDLVGIDELVEDVIADIDSENFQGANGRLERVADRA